MSYILWQSVTTTTSFCHHCYIESLMHACVHLLRTYYLGRENKSKLQVYKWHIIIYGFLNLTNKTINQTSLIPRLDSLLFTCRLEGRRPHVRFVDRVRRTHKRTFLFWRELWWIRWVSLNNILEKTANDPSFSNTSSWKTNGSGEDMCSAGTYVELRNK